MTNVTIADRLTRVNARTTAIDPGRALASGALAPLLLIGWLAFWLCFGLIWAGGWVKNGVAEGWASAKDHSPRTKHGR